MMKVIAVILTGLLVLLQYRLWFGSGSIPQVRQLEKARQEQILENNVLRERNRSLTAEVLDLKTGLDAIEERARTEMGMIKQGETFYQIVNMKQPVSSPPKNN
jgi:cell division protein FtsB